MDTNGGKGGERFKLKFRSLTLRYAWEMLARAAFRTLRPVLHRLPVRSASSFFTKEHEYATVRDGIATCGITDFAQSQLGDVVYVSLPKAGDAVKKG